MGWSSVMSFASLLRRQLATFGMTASTGTPAWSSKSARPRSSSESISRRKAMPTPRISPIARPSAAFSALFGLDGFPGRFASAAMYGGLSFAGLSVSRSEFSWLIWSLILFASALSCVAGWPFTSTAWMRAYSDCSCGCSLASCAWIGWRPLFT